MVFFLNFYFCHSVYTVSAIKTKIEIVQKKGILNYSDLQLNTIYELIDMLQLLLLHAKALDMQASRGKELAARSMRCSQDGQLRSPGVHNTPASASRQAASVSVTACT